MGDCQPSSLFVLPDPALVCAEVLSVTSEAGPCTPKVGVSDDNCGDLLPTFSGIPEDPAAPNIEIELTESGNGGGSGGNAGTSGGFMFRELGADLFIGADDGRRYHRQWGLSVDANAPDKAPNGHGLAYCTKEKLIVAIWKNQPLFTDGDFTISTRDIDDVYDTWVETALDPDDFDGPPITQIDNVHGVALAYIESSSRLLLAYAYRKEGTTGPDDQYLVAVAKSLDCGVTWRLLATDLFDGFLASEQISRNGHALRMTVSGSWVRIDMPNDDVDGAMLTVASHDGGITWSQTITSPISLFQAVIRPFDPSPFDVCGIGGGRFIIVYNDDAGNDVVRSGEAFGSGVYTAIGGPADLMQRVVPGPIWGIGCVVSNDRVYALVSYHNGGGLGIFTQVSLFYHSISGITAQNMGGDPDPLNPVPEAWRPVIPISLWLATRFLAIHFTMIDLGRSVMVMHGNGDVVDDSVRDNDTIVLEIGGLTVQSLGAVPPGNDLTSGFAPPFTARFQLYSILWQASTGEAAGGGTGIGGTTSPDTLWTRTVVGPTVIAWTPRQWRVETVNVADLGYLEYLQAGADNTDSWGINGAVFGAIVRIVSGSSQVTSSHGMRIDTIATGVDLERRLRIRMDTSGFTVRDTAAGADVASIAIDMTNTSFTEVRLLMKPTGSACTVFAAHMDDYFNPPAFVDFTSGTILDVAAADRLRFGCLVGTAVGESRWREVWVTTEATQDAEQDAANPGEGMFGLPLASTPVLITNCVSISWGGGSGADGDKYVSRDCFLHAAPSIFTDACLIDWRSGGVDPQVAQILILDVDPDGKGRTTLQDTVVVCGVEDAKILVDYDNDAAFASPTAASVIDTTYWTDLEVTSVVRNIVSISSTSGRKPNVAALTGQRWEFLTGVLAGNRYRILYACDDVTDQSAPIRMVLDTNVGVLGATATDTGVVYLTYGIVQIGARRRQRYMRFRFEDVITASGDHRLGAIVAGCSLAPPFELEWTHSDGRQSDVQIFEGPSISWAYERGKPRKTWTGRIVNDHFDWRQSFDGMVSALARYEARPMVFVRDLDNVATLIRGRYTPSDLENSFWFDPKDGDGTERFPGGDLRLSIIEVP